MYSKYRTNWTQILNRNISTPAIICHKYIRIIYCMLSTYGDKFDFFLYKKYLTALQYRIMVAACVYVCVY